VKPHRLTDGDTLSKMSDADLTAIFAHGDPVLNKSPLMAPYGYTLSKSEIQAMVAYIRMLSHPRHGALVIAYARWLCIVVLTLAPFSAPQALTPAEIKEPQMRALQEKHFQQLQTIGSEVQAHIFPYAFYFSRVLDLELSQQERADQRSLRFDNYGGMTVVEITGNYFASYSSDMVDKSHRALRTFQDVMVPIVEIAMSELKDNPDVEGFAMEISHHVRGKAMGMSMERPENLVLVLSKNAALRLVNGKTESDRQAAILDGQFLINGEPFILYLNDRAAMEAARLQEQNPMAAGAGQESGQKSKSSKLTSTATVRPLPRTVPPDPPPSPSRDTSPDALAKMQVSFQKLIDVVLKEVDSQGHFVAYAPPTMVAFRKGAYLEFSANTTLPPSAAGSRYKMAALAFDDHVAHLVRPVMAYFKGDLDFDGIAFSTTIHLAGKSASTEGSEAVEYFFPTAALRCYETYDCTGQQLIDQGSVLINGERVSLDLQIAETGTR
jgi:hypothetical protein